jgi:hypothetical protein
MRETKTPQTMELIPGPAKRPEPDKGEAKVPAVKPGEATSPAAKVPEQAGDRPPAGGPTRLPKAPDSGDDRRAALWVLEHGGTVFVSRSGQQLDKEVNRPNELPKGRFYVLNVALDKARDVDDAGLTALEGLTNLTTLDLSNTAVTDRGIAKLRSLRVLKDLALRNTNISDGAISNLQRLDGLQFLSLEKTKITADGLRKLSSALPKCSISADDQ